MMSQTDKQTITIVQSLFTLIFLKKRFNMLSRCLVASITKKVISYLLVLRQQPLRALQTQDFHFKVFQYLKINRNFFKLKLFL